MLTDTFSDTFSNGIQFDRFFISGVNSGWSGTLARDAASEDSDIDIVVSLREPVFSVRLAMPDVIRRAVRRS